MNRKKDARCVPKSAGHSNGNTGNRNSNTGAAQICSSGRAGAQRFDSAPSNLRMNRLAGRFTSGAPATSKPTRQQHQRRPPKKLKQAAATTSTAMLVSLRTRRTARSGCATCANREIGVPRQTKNGAARLTIRPAAHATWLLGCVERRLSGSN